MILPATPEEILQCGQFVQYAPTDHARGIKNVLDGQIGAMVLYDNWTPAAVQMHICITDKRAFTRKFLREVFWYPFVQCQREMVIGVIPADNTESISIATRTGFVETYRIKNGWDTGVDMVLHEMQKSACTWIRTRGRVPTAGAQGPTSHSLRMANG